MEPLSHTTADTTDQAAEELLYYTVSDEALEAAMGTERGDTAQLSYQNTSWTPTGCC
jgi:hypothetical protein